MRGVNYTSDHQKNMHVRFWCMFVFGACSFWVGILICWKLRRDGGTSNLLAQSCKSPHKRIIFKYKLTKAWEVDKEDSVFSIFFFFFFFFMRPMTFLDRTVMNYLFTNFDQRNSKAGHRQSLTPSHIFTYFSHTKQIKKKLNNNRQ